MGYDRHVYLIHCRNSSVKVVRNFQKPLEEKNYILLGSKIMYTMVFPDIFHYNIMFKRKLPRYLCVVH